MYNLNLKNIDNFNSDLRLIQNINFSEDFSNVYFTFEENTDTYDRYGIYLETNSYLFNCNIDIVENDNIVEFDENLDENLINQDNSNFWFLIDTKTNKSYLVYVDIFNSKINKIKVDCILEYFGIYLLVNFKEIKQNYLQNEIQSITLVNISNQIFDVIDLPALNIDIEKNIEIGLKNNCNDIICPIKIIQNDTKEEIFNYTINNNNIANFVANKSGLFTIYPSLETIKPKIILVKPGELHRIGVTHLLLNEIFTDIELEFTLFDKCDNIITEGIFNNGNFSIESDNRQINFVKKGNFKNGKCFLKINYIYYLDNIINFTIIDNKLQIPLEKYTTKVQFDYDRLPENYIDFSIPDYTTINNEIEINYDIKNVYQDNIIIVYKINNIENSFHYKLNMNNETKINFTTGTEIGIMDIYLQWKNSKSLVKKITILDNKNLGEIINKYKGNSDILSQRVESITKNNEKLVCDLFSKTQEINEQHSRICLLEELYNKEKKEYNDMREHIKNDASKYKQINEDNFKLKRNINLLEKELELTNNNLKAKIEDNKQLEIKLEELSTKLKQFEVDYDNVNSQLNGLKEEKKDIEPKIKLYEENKTKLVSLKKYEDELKQNKEKNKKLEDNLKKYIEEFEIYKKESDNKYKKEVYERENLEIEVINLKDTTKKAEQKIEKLDSISSQLKEDPNLIIKQKTKILDLENQLRLIKKTHIPRNGNEALSLLYSND